MHQVRRQLRNVADVAIRAERPLTKADMVALGLADAFASPTELEAARRAWQSGEKGAARQRAQAWVDSLSMERSDVTEILADESDDDPRAIVAKIPR